MVVALQTPCSRIDRGTQGSWENGKVSTFSVYAGTQHPPNGKVKVRVNGELRDTQLSVAR